MKHTKKVLALLIFAAMSLSLAACGDDESSSGAQNEPASAVSDEQAEESSGSPAEESSDSGSSESTPSSDATAGQTLLGDFRSNADSASSAQSLAEIITANENIQFQPMVMPVEPGLLTGLGNAEITGFKEGVVFSPMIGSIPFIGYVFILDDGTDADAFVQTLKDNADPRWNVCTEAEETVVENVNGKVFFLMCPKSFDMEPDEGMDMDMDMDMDEDMALE